MNCIFSYGSFEFPSLANFDHYAQWAQANFIIMDDDSTRMVSNSTTSIGDVGDSTGNPGHFTTDSNGNTKLDIAGAENDNELNEIMAKLNNSKLGNDEVTAKYRRLIEKWMKHLIKNLTSL